MSKLVWPDDYINKIICGDCLEVMKEMPDECIDMVICSPPYWGLRDYGIEQIFGGNGDCEHGWIDKTIIRCTPGDRPSEKSMIAKNRPNETVNRPNIKQNICLKCQAWKGQLGLELSPEMYIEHLIEIFNEVKRVLKKEGTLWLNMGDTYGGSGGAGGDYNEGGLREGQPRFKQGKTRLQPKCLCMIPERLAWSLIQNGWILRNKIVWYKPNAMPSSVEDRFSNRWEYIFMFSKSRKYYFDLDAVREEHTSTKWGGTNDSKCKEGRYAMVNYKLGIRSHKDDYNPLGKNPGDVLEINTQPFPQAHFAVFPEELCIKPIKAGCPEGGIVLDPFCGAGTALYVAKQLRRRFIGIDIKKEYCEMSEKRLIQGVL